MTVRIDHTLHRLKADIAGYSKQVRFGHVLGLTKTAQDVKAAEVEEMKRVFDRPTRYTLNAVRVWPAKVSKPEAVTWLRDDGTGGIAPANYLQPQIDGGSRRQKRFEKQLQDAGVLPQGWFAIPGPGAKRNAAGNMPGGQYVAILSAFRAFNLAGSDMNRTSRSQKKNKNLRNFFASTPRTVQRARNGGRLPYGVYERMKNGEVRTILRFRPRVNYKRRLDWQRVADDVIAKNLQKNIANGISRAFGTARPD